MKVLIIDVDSQIPNLALMRVSAYHKKQKDTVNLVTLSPKALKKRSIPLDLFSHNPDMVYIACVFTNNKEISFSIRDKFRNQELSIFNVLIGGSGIDYYCLPEKMQLIKPDYDLYNNLVCQKCGKKIDYCRCFKGPSPGNMFYSMGFTTRGCIRKCDFCIVPYKEGKLERYQYVHEFLDDRFNTVVLLDNNVYADKEWFFKNTDDILEKGLKFNAIQGMDIRIIDNDIAKRLKELKWFGQMHFAFDNTKDEKAVRRGIKILKDAGIDIKNRVKFYVLVGYNTNEEEDLYRCNLLRDLGTMAYVMPYVKNEWTRTLSRWANSPPIYWSVPFEDYSTKKGREYRKEKQRNEHIQIQ